MNIYKALIVEPIDDTLTELQLVLRTANQYRAVVAFNNFMQFGFFKVESPKTLFYSADEYIKDNADTLFMATEALKVIKVIESYKDHLLTVEQIQDLFGIKA